MGSIRRLGIEEAVRGRCYPAGYDEAGLHWMECMVWDGALHLGYCRYSRDEDSLLDYFAQERVTCNRLHLAMAMIP